jgi:hypothetical protein
MAGNGRVAGAGWLALHLVLLGAVTNAIVGWSEQFAAALLRTPASSERAALARVFALNLAVLAVLVGLYVGRPALTVAGAGLLAVVVVAHACSLTSSIRRSLAARLGGTVWVLRRGQRGAGRRHRVGAAHGRRRRRLGRRLPGGPAGPRAPQPARLGGPGGARHPVHPVADRAAHPHGARLPAVVNAVLLLTVGGLAVAAAGLLARHRGLALAGLAGYAAGLAAALVPVVRTLLRRPRTGRAAWMLAAGTAWFSLAVLADLAAPPRPARPGRGRRLRAADPDRGAHLPAAGGVGPRRARQPHADQAARGGLAGAGGSAQPGVWCCWRLGRSGAGRSSVAAGWPVSRLARLCCWPGRSWPGEWSGTPAAKSGLRHGAPGDQQAAGPPHPESFDAVVHPGAPGCWHA